MSDSGITITDNEIELASYPILAPIRVRKENEGYLVLVNWMEGNWYCASENVMDILNLCDGKHTVMEVAETFAAEFPDTDPEIIKKDVLKILVNAKQISFIKFKGADIDE